MTEVTRHVTIDNILAAAGAVTLLSDITLANRHIDAAIKGVDADMRLTRIVHVNVVECLLKARHLLNLPAITRTAGDHALEAADPFFPLKMAVIQLMENRGWLK